MHCSLVRAYQGCHFFCSWTTLPSLPTARCKASALCVDQTPDVVLVVGGANEHDYLNCAELLYPSQTGQPWRWRALTPMNEPRFKPGVILLSGNEETQRILVAGGCKNTAELLKLTWRNTADLGQWTLIAPQPELFDTTSLVCFNGCILAIGRFRGSHLNFICH